MSIPITEKGQLADGLDTLFESVEREEDRLECRSGSAVLVFDGTTVNGSMPLHETHVEEVEEVEIDVKGREIVIKADSADYTFRVPGE